MTLSPSKVVKYEEDFEVTFSTCQIEDIPLCPTWQQLHGLIAVQWEEDKVERQRVADEKKATPNYQRKYWRLSRGWERDGQRKYKRRG